MSVVRVPEFQAIERIPNPFTSQLRLQDWERPGIALALGGGFARGFAHLGVFEVLREENIPIAGIVGTSIGALLGAACADGVAIQELLRLGRNVRVRDILRFRNCRQGPQSRDCIGRFVRDNFRIARLEELPIPTAVVATNLDTFEPYIFRSGCIETAIRASCAFPGMFCPVELDGRVLVDGCMVAPVPTEIAARMSADCVLGVSVDANSQHVSSRGEVFRVFDRARRGAAKETFPPWITHADIMLEPAISHLNLMDFSRVDESHAAGVEAMRRALPFVRAILERQSHKASADVFDKPRRALIS